MDEKLMFAKVQKQIGYPFKNLDLLRQAFTRRSYTEEHGGENNEVLEFIGDKVLDFVVVKVLAEIYGTLPQNPSAAHYGCYSALHKALEKPPYEFRCKRNEGELTKIKSRLVEKRYLASRMDELGFTEHLRMGAGDVKNNVQDEPSVKEDLFEAVLGAIALDCDWDMKELQSAVEAMLNFDDFLDDVDTNYVRLIQEWSEENSTLPWFWFEKANQSVLFLIPFDGVDWRPPQKYDTSKIQYSCMLKLADSLPLFRAFGASKREARRNVCELAYDYLDKHELLFSIQDEIENPNEQEAIGQLEILARRGYFSLPTYNFSETHDEDGNPIWECHVHIKEEARSFAATASSKTTAKKSAAYRMLCHILSQGGVQRG